MAANFDAYKIFYFVGRYKNITRTANALCISQSTVSRCIQNLEADLGCRLFSRSQNGVAFTKRGEMLYNHVARACEDIFLGEEKLRLMQRGIRSVRLNVSEFFLWQFILPVMQDFHAAWPDVCLELTTHSLNGRKEAMDELSGGLTDLVCTMAPVTNPGGAVIREIADFEDILVAGSRFSELREGAYYLSQLAEYPFAALCSREQGPNFYDRLFAMQGMDTIPIIKVDTASLLLPLVKRGMCLAFIPAPFRKQIESTEGVFPIRIRDEMPTQSICIAAAETENQSQPVKDLTELICRYAGTLEAYDRLPD